MDVRKKLVEMLTGYSIDTKTDVEYVADHLIAHGVTIQERVSVNDRLTKNPDRIQYAIKQFEKHGIEYYLKNEQAGHFHCHRKCDDKLFQFYAGTGKIMGYQNAKGIHALIKMLTGSCNNELPTNIRPKGE